MKRSRSKAQPVLENTPHREWESFHCEVVRGPGYGAQWHFHPEHQLTLVLKSRGHRVVGDSLAPLTDGDLVLVAGNVPHVWHQDERSPKEREVVHAIVIRFRDDFLGHDFLRKPELQPVRALMRRAARGLQVSGITRKTVAEQVQLLARAKGLERVILLLAILAELAKSRELKALSSARFLPELQAGDQDRMSRVLGYIHVHLFDLISREAVAARAGLSCGAFSRFFKTRTGKTLPQYVNELRVGRACSRLAETDDKISDIALDCGFSNLSGFNRQFQQIAGMTPKAYRQTFDDHTP
ncbi:MAG TPA: AraC family transcriptional regulator [Verrucomicrobiaceae bacterium]|jgi:AraC-like DNA-binding protein